MRTLPSVVRVAIMTPALHLLMSRVDAAAATTNDYAAVTARSFLRKLTETCPEQHCSNATVTTYDPTNCNSSGITYVTLNSTTHGSDTLIELLGPSDPADAAAIVISAPHGGSLKPGYITTRSPSGPFCPSSGCRTVKDSYTREIAEGLRDKIIQNYCKVPYVVINHLHRSKLDANREKGEAAQNHTIAEAAWEDFHDFVAQAQQKVIDQFGTVTNTDGKDGAVGLLFDVHGYAGYDWDSDDGAPFIQWGYRLSSSTLDPTTYCPVDDRSSGTIGSLTHARFLDGQSLECLVRGPGSLAARVTEADVPGSALALCGAGTPGPDYPSPEAIASDSAHCEDMCGSSPDPCHFYSGGYDLKVHEHLEWRDETGTLFNGVQAELPRCIRFGGSSIRTDFADALSVAMCSFLGDVFGSDKGTC